MTQGPTFDRFLQRVLPSGSHNHVWALGEDHRESYYKRTLITALPKLSGAHHVGAVLEESPSYLMLFLWAHQDGHITAQDVENALITYGSNTFEALNVSDLMIAAQQNGVRTGFFDSRVLLSEHLQKHHKTVASTTAKWPLSYADAAGSGRRTGWLLVRAQELYDSHPVYKERLDRIEGFIRTMREQGALSDVTSAHLATALMQPGKNAITMSGAWHLEGISYNKPQLEGVFAQSLRRQGKKDEALQVSTALMGESLMFRAFNHIELHDRNNNCKSFSQYDHFYITDKDEWIAFDGKDGKASRINSLGYTADPFACTQSPDVDTVYTHHELQPWRANAEVAEAIDWLRAAQFYDISFVKGTTPAEKKSHAMDSLDRLASKLGKQGDGLFNPAITPALFVRFLQEAQAGGSVTPQEIADRYLEARSPHALTKELRGKVVPLIDKGRLELVRQLLGVVDVYLDGDIHNDEAQLRKDAPLLRRHASEQALVGTYNDGADKDKTDKPQPFLFVSKADAEAFAQTVVAMKDRLTDHDISGDDAQALLQAYRQHVRTHIHQPDDTPEDKKDSSAQSGHGLSSQQRDQFRSIRDSLPKI